MASRRLERLPAAGVPRIYLASSWRARLLGLAGLAPSALRPGEALFIPRCRSVHTFGMRFRLDLVFVDERGAPVRVVRGVGPGRVVACRRAAGVIELASSSAGRRRGPQA